MAIYRCPECEQFIDDDWHPGDTTEQYGDTELVCPACVEDLEEDE